MDIIDIVDKIINFFGEKSELASCFRIIISASFALFTALTALVYFKMLKGEDCRVSRKRMRYLYFFCFFVVTVINHLNIFALCDDVDGEGLFSLLFYPYFFFAALPLLIGHIMLFVFNTELLNYDNKSKDKLLVIIGFIIGENAYASIMPVIGCFTLVAPVFACALIVGSICFATVYCESTGKATYFKPN